MNALQDSSRVNPKANHPGSVTLLASGVLIITVLHWMRVIETIRRWGFLSQPPVSFSHLHLAYLVISGVVWGVAGLPLVWGLWRGLQWAPRATRIAALSFAAYYWIERLLLTVTSQKNGLFAVGATILSLVIVFWVFARPKIRAFFA